MSIVVMGSGIDAQVAAHVLARRGRRVTLLEQPGQYDYSGWLAPQIVAELGLRERGLRMEERDPWVRAPLEAGGTFELSRNVDRSAEAISRLSKRDAERWPRFCERMARVAAFLEQLYLAPPPDPLAAGFALRARRLGREGLTDLMRFLPKSAAELLDDWFESQPLKGLLGALAVHDLQQGVRSGGTAFSLVHANVGNPPGVFIAPPNNAGEIFAKLDGIERRTGEVTRIVVRKGRVEAVVLADGQELAAGQVVCDADPRRVLTELVDPGWLDPELLRAVRHIRCRAVAARIDVALDRAAPFSALVIAPSLNYVEKAYDRSKYAEASTAPVLIVRTGEPHRLVIDMQYVPRTQVDAAEVQRRALDALAPQLGGAQVRHASVALPGARPPYAELTLDQALWMRPLSDLARYRTPIQGLWLTGTSMHPGPGTRGAAGYNCARELLRG